MSYYTAIEHTDQYCSLHPHEFNQKSDAEQIDLQIRMLMDKLDEVINEVNSLGQLLADELS